MAVDLTDAVNGDGLFDLLGKAFALQAVIETSRRTDVPTKADALYAQHNNLTPTADLEAVAVNLPAAVRGYKSAGSGLMGSVRSYARSLIVAMVDADSPLPRRTLSLALAELVRQMEAGAESLDAPAVAVTVTPAVGNDGDGLLLVTTTGSDAVARHFAVPETITGTVTDGGAVRLRGLPAVDVLSADWPAGSGCDVSLSPEAGGGLLTNGGFDAEDDVPNAPDGWIVLPGTIGTTVKMTDPEVQTLTVTGTPTGGTYLLSWTDADGKVYTTAPLAYNAGGSDVQSALRLLPGLEDVEVGTSGTVPGYTHTVTFEGIGGNVAQLSVTNRLTGGSSPTVTPATTSAGTAHVYGGGRALELDSDGSELTTLYQRIRPAALTAYAVNLWAKCDVAPAVGVVTLDLVDGIGGTVLQDAAGSNCSVSFNAASLTTSWQTLDALSSGECVFRLPEVLPTVVYFRLRISTAVSSGTSVYLDRASLVQMAPLYRGGPLAAAFAGAEPFGPDDRFTVAVTNDRAGLLLEWLHRNCDLVSLGVVIPTNSAGAETVPDSLVS